MRLIGILFVLTTSLVLCGCGETLVTYRYEYEDTTLKLKGVDVNFSVIATFNEDVEDPNKGAFEAPYFLRVAVFVPSSTQFAKIAIQELKVMGVDSKTSLDLKASSTDKTWKTLNPDAEKQAAIVVAIPVDSSLIYEALRIQGVVHVTLNNGETYLESDFNVQLNTNYQEERQNKLLSGILGI